MTTQEFSNQFDILYNNIMSNQAPGLDSYEKSVFLTKAQEETVISLYNGKNPFKDSFEKTEEMRRYLASLSKTYTTSKLTSPIEGLSDNSCFFQLPTDLMFITYESGIFNDTNAGCMDGKEAIIIPVSQDDYWKMSENPFRGPSIRRALRLDKEDNIVEILTDFNINSYTIRYIKKPKPIILETLTNPLTINGISVVTECELPSTIHRAILNRAVDLARLAYKQ